MAASMKFVIITGLSGAGKSYAMRIMEDLDYYCIDNMPPSLMSTFASMCTNLKDRIDKVAFVFDIRGGELFDDLFDDLDRLAKDGHTYNIIFLDASDDTLLSRYKESRRTHPFSKEGMLISDALVKERKYLEKVREHANFIIDTTDLNNMDLKQQLLRIFVEGKDPASIINISVVSFGFKYGTVSDADLVLDVRFLPNPYYIPELKKKTGLDAEVFDYVNSFQQTRIFQDKLYDMIDFLMPHYIHEGKTRLVVGIGCTGGKHRSVTLARQLYTHLQQKDYCVTLEHRDIGK